MDTKTDFKDPGQTFVSFRALGFMKNSAQMASKMGLRKGLSKAATKVNPALLACDAVISVADCIQSFIELSEAREIRDSLSEENELLIEELRLKREELDEQVKVARKKVEKEKAIKDELSGMVKICQELFSQTMSTLTEIRRQRLPNLEKLETIEDRLLNDWESLKHALKLYRSQGEKPDVG